MHLLRISIFCTTLPTSPHLRTSTIILYFSYLDCSHFSHLLKSIFYSCGSNSLSHPFSSGCNQSSLMHLVVFLFLPCKQKFSVIRKKLNSGKNASERTRSTSLCITLRGTCHHVVQLLVTVGSNPWLK